MPAGPSGRTCHSPWPASASHSSQRLAAAPRSPTPWRPGSAVGWSRTPLTRPGMERNDSLCSAFRTVSALPVGSTTSMSGHSQPPGSPVCRWPISSCRRKSTICWSWPTTCGGPGRRRPATCSRRSSRRRGRATAIRSSCCSTSTAAAGKAVLQRDDFITAHDAVVREFEAYLDPARPTWFSERFPDYDGGPIAYFSMEYGLHQSLAIYSGGLGVLTGDHCKSASDLGLPFVAVGLIYRRGYFQQTIDADGFQQHHLPRVRLPPPAAAAGARRHGAASGGAGADAGPGRVGTGLAGPGGPRAGAAARHRHLRATTRPTGRSPRCSTCAAARCGCARRWSWASAACARWRRSASSRRSGTSTRGTAPCCSSSGCARRWRRGEASRRRGARVAGPHHRLHHPHAGAGRQRAVRPRAGRDATSRRWCRAGVETRQILELGAGGPRRAQPAAQPDRAGAAHLRLRQRRQPAPRRGGGSDVAAHLSRRRRPRSRWSTPSPTACTCRPGSGPRCASCCARHLGAGWYEQLLEPGGLGADRRDPRRGSVERPPGAEGAADALHARRGYASSTGATAGRPASCARSTSSSTPTR